MNTYLWFVHSLVDEHLFDFHFSATVSNAVMKFVHTFLRGCTSSISFFMKITIFDKERNMLSYANERKVLMVRIVREQDTEMNKPAMGVQGEVHTLPGPVLLHSSIILWASSICYWDPTGLPTSTAHSQGWAKLVHPTHKPPKSSTVASNMKWKEMFEPNSDMFLKGHQNVFSLMPEADQ